ncbi:hypothetical protein PS467_20795 [Streptomyces luomodiensis]|uniref:Uncharacterized protein n=1 Tax=Streptomyces luomodiensis TaxID=3026192 RepID=A0ABY9UYD8_9ACTN|nr:hypothetical protein [Streptomyces sp. SCA4-21]WNE97594.1 hypothetical protein PS467_20795 [Streptomyces sp. SCA4-21]
MQSSEASESAGAAPYVRFQSTVRNARGYYTGVFGLVNGLARAGKLTAEQERFRRTNNDWYNAVYPDPSTVDPTVYDHELHPGAAAWFKSASRELIQRVDGYLRILTAHGIECRMLSSSNPGRIVYEDAHQIVVVPHTGVSGRSHIRSAAVPTTRPSPPAHHSPDP